MKGILKSMILVLAGVFFLTSCSNHQAQITELIGDIETAINEKDTEKFKSCVSEDAEDYKLVENGSFDMSMLAGTYVFEDVSEADVPDFADEITMTIKTDIKDDQGTVQYEGKDTAFLFKNHGSRFVPDFKVLEIELYGFSEPFYQIPPPDSSRSESQELPGFIILKKL